MTQQTWDEKAESFQRIREQIKELLKEAQQPPVHMAYIYTMFMYKFNYLPDIERRMRELIENGEVTKTHDPIPKYKLV